MLTYPQAARARSPLFSSLMSFLKASGSQTRVKRGRPFISILFVAVTATSLVAQQQAPTIVITEPAIPRNFNLLSQGMIEMTFLVKSADIRRIRIRVVTPLDAATKDISIDTSQDQHSITINLFKGTNRITLFGFGGDNPDPAISAAIDVTCNGRRCGASHDLVGDLTEERSDERNKVVGTTTAANDEAVPSSDQVHRSMLRTAPVPTLFENATPAKGSGSPKPSTNNDPVSSTSDAPAFPTCGSSDIPVIVSGNVTVRNEPKSTTSALAQGDVTVNFGDASRTFHTDSDGYYDFSTCQTGEYTISVVRGGYSATEPFTIGAGDIQKKVDLELLVRPLGEYSRAIVGFEQAGASAAKGTQKYFFDLTVSTPVFGKLDPLFGRRGRAWGSVRLRLQSSNEPS